MDDDSLVYISKQPAERQAILKEIHATILQRDKTVAPVVEPMMGKEMIIYKAKGMMKYALSGVKNYMSLHLLPMYGSPPLYSKYKALLDRAAFQKGCINFTSADQVPLHIVTDLITDCSRIDLAKMREEYLAGKKTAKKQK